MKRRDHGKGFRACRRVSDIKSLHPDAGGSPPTEKSIRKYREHAIRVAVTERKPIPPVLAPALMMAFWALLGGAAGIRVVQGIWPYFGFGGGEVAVAIPVGGVAGALIGALLGLIRNPRWLVLLMAVFAASAAGAVAGKVLWGELGEVGGQLVGAALGGIAWAVWLIAQRR